MHYGIYNSNIRQTRACEKKRGELSINAVTVVVSVIVYLMGYYYSKNMFRERKCMSQNKKEDLCLFHAGRLKDACSVTKAKS